MRMKGFTFLEVTLLVAIILVVGVTSAWFSTKFFFQQQTVIAAQLVRSSLAQANLNAQNGKAYADWGVTYTDDTLILFAGSSYEDRNREFDELVEIPTGVTITGLDEVIFIRLTGETDPALIILSGNDQSVRYSINRLGTITEL